jgi:hypothetical protein
VSPAERIAELQLEIDRLNARETVIVGQLDGCVGTRTRACGLSLTEAPNPWLGLNGQKCRGYDTLSARYADFCGYWDASVRFHLGIVPTQYLTPARVRSQYNVDAAPADEKKCALLSNSASKHCD